MKGFELTHQELLQLRMVHKSERFRHAAYKINAVILLGTGWSVEDVSNALLLDEKTLRRYVKQYQKGGIDELLETRFHGRAPRLSDQQILRLMEELESKIYLTTDAVIEFIENEFSETYSRSGIRDLLHRLGYEHKKPKLVPGNPDIDAQEFFVDCYDDFMHSKPRNTEVIFIDAVHPEHNTMAAYGWIKKGQTRQLQTNSGRQRLNLHGAINAETMEMTVIESQSINRESTVQLLEMLDKKYEHSDDVVVILDNAGYHYSKEVKAVINNSPRLRLVYLPPYSPELNLIERVWKFFKKKVLYNKYYQDVQSFKSAAIHFFQKIGDYADDLHSLLSGGFQVGSTGQS